MILNSIEEFKALYEFGPKQDLFMSKELKDVLLSKDPRELVELIKIPIEKNDNKGHNNKVSRWFLSLRIISFLGAEILSKVSKEYSLDGRFHVEILQRGFYESIDIYDNIVKDNNYSDYIRLHCAELCSIDTLRLMVDCEDYKIREVAFKRLGPKECLGHMSKDKRLEIRELAAKLTPISSDSLFLFCNDKSKRVVLAAINKITVSKIPFLIGNKNIQNNSKILNIIKDRFSKNV